MNEPVDLLGCDKPVSGLDADRALPPMPPAYARIQTRQACVTHPLPAALDVPPTPDVTAAHPMSATWPAPSTPDATTAPPAPETRAVPPTPPASAAPPASATPAGPVTQAVPPAAPAVCDTPLLPEDRSVPPTPPGPSSAGQAEPTPDVMQALTDTLADLVPVDDIQVDGNFFDDLGADSMVMARFCARLRKQPGMPAVSMKDIYEHPTVGELAAALSEEAPPAVAPTATLASTTMDVRAPVGTPLYLLCGVLQFLFLAGYAFLGTLVFIRGFLWLSSGFSVSGLYLRAAALTSTAFFVACVVPIVAKWVLIGRWKPQAIRIWSLGYVRFWVVKTLIRSSPIVALNGRSTTCSASPLYPLYLRALGAKIGRGVTILSSNMPVCTDLLTIGNNTVVSKDSFISGYRANGDFIETGSVTLGKHVYIGEATVLDINTTVENGAQLGHTSSLQAGQTIPADGRYQGAPARPVEADYRTANVAVNGSRRRVGYAFFQLFSALTVAPLALTVAVLVIGEVPALRSIVSPQTAGLRWFELTRIAAIVSALLLLVGIVGSLLIAGIVPRILKRFVKPGTTYPLYGFHYVIHRTIAGLTNVQFFNTLFGDSSYIVHYLQWIGYDLSTVEQTGSNFGTQVKHESPFLTSVGTGTVVADGLSVMNASFSSTSFRVEPVAIGSNNFLGNNIAYPAQGMTGDDCLLATKVSIPVSGDVRQGVGLLGSPNFQIPRSVERDRALEIRYNEELIRPLLLGVKNRHNLVTMGLFLLLRWLLGVVLILILAGIFAGQEVYGPWAIAVGVVVGPLVTIGYWALVDKAVSHLQALEPDGCSIYHRNFWRHERYWKLPAFRYLQAYNGTPFKAMIWRLLGVRIGSRMFDDGCFIVEKSFATIGDNCTFNAGTVVQCHSQEDGGFKSDRTSIGSNCTLGVGAFVHYGVTIGEGSELLADSFLMKGQEVPPQTTWVGNPAQEVPK